MERGKLIILEGVGGAGKSTQIGLLKEHLDSVDKKVVVTREPGGVTEAEVIRKLIFELKGAEAINADHQMALFFAARYFWMLKLLSPNISLGVNVVSDRCFTTTAAYQGYAEGGSLLTIEKIARVVMGEYWPDAVVLLDVSAKEAMRRGEDKGEFDPFDLQGADYFRRVVEGYREMAATNWAGIQWYVVNGEKSIEEVARELQQVVDGVIG